MKCDGCGSDVTFARVQVVGVGSYELHNGHGGIVARASYDLGGTLTVACVACPQPQECP